MKTVFKKKETLPKQGFLVKLKDIYLWAASHFGPNACCVFLQRRCAVAKTQVRSGTRRVVQGIARIGAASSHVCAVG